MTSSMTSIQRVAIALLAAVFAVSSLAPAAAAAHHHHHRHARRQAATPHDSGASEGMTTGDSPSQVVVQAMQQMHLTVCAQRVQQAMTFLSAGQQARFVAQPLGPDSDRWPTVFMIESADPAGGRTRLSTLTIAPNCAGLYEQIIYWSEPCASVKATVFAKYTGEHPMLKDVKVSDAGPALQVYLTPAGGGCVSVKKELFR